MTASYIPSRHNYDAAMIHLLNSGELIRPPKGVIAKARSLGACYRQIFAQYRREMSLGIVTENAIEFRP